MKLNPKLKIKLNKLIFLITAWLFIGLVLSVYDHVTILSNYSLGFSEHYSFLLNVGFNIAAAFIGSTLGGLFLIFYMEEKARYMSYGKAMIMVAVVYVTIVSFITVVLGAVFVPAQMGQSLFSTAGQEAYLAYLTNPVHTKNILIWSIIVALTQLTIQIDNKFGRGILLNFIKGKYKIPRTEVRIFMFADIKSSTTLAEKLGNEQYHKLLKDFFNDITNAVIYNEGEIYQYVGDEVVISWPLETGLKDQHCIQCFKYMKRKIKKEANRYMQTYGVVPDFKAGVHFGEVIAGEIGVIKRDITYSGDVLNTTARIQGICNNLNVDFLISEDLVKQFNPQSKYSFRSLGDVELKGKQEKVAVCTFK